MGTSRVAVEMTVEPPTTALASAQADPVRARPSPVRRTASRAHTGSTTARRDRPPTRPTRAAIPDHLHGVAVAAGKHAGAGQVTVGHERGQP